MTAPWINTTLVQETLLGGVYVARFLTEPSDEPRASFDGVCTVAVAGKVAEIHGMMGKVKRHHLRSLVSWLLGADVWEIRAHRAEGRILPGARVHGDWSVIDLLALSNKKGIQ